jgi:DNA-binding CsgD family transcriptional regulator/tetratricopeptide (TPR) repeat protein
MTTNALVICPVLVGRDDLLRLAERRLGEAAASHGGLLCLAGEAGVGKTRLAGAIERRAASSGFIVARGIAYPRDLEVAGGVFLDLARSLGRVPGLEAVGAALGERLGGSGAGDPALGDAHRRRRILMLDVVDLLASVAARERILLTLEDLHWADDLTLEILGALARRLPELPMVILATYRSDELYPRVPMREWRTRLLSGRLAEEARVSRLDRDGTASMTTLILGTGLPAPRDLVTSIHDRSDGVPLHVEELLAVLRAAGPEALTSTVVPETLDEAILLRAARLSSRARRVADAAAVIGRSFDVSLLASVVGRSDAHLSAPLKELESAYFVVETTDTGRLDFRHALIRDALYGQVPDDVRRRLHGRVADASARDPRFDAAFRSTHLEEAGRKAEAFAAALEGGRRAAAMSAHREALELLERARRTAPTSLEASIRAAMLAELADEATAVDANETADGCYTEAIALLESIGDLRAAAALVPRQVAVRHLLGDDLHTRSEPLEAAVHALEAMPDDRATRAVRARLLAGLAAANMLDRRLETAISFGEAGRALAIETGERGIELDVAATVGACLVFAGRMDEGWALLEHAVGEARSARREAETARAYRMIGSCASVLVEYVRADRWLRDGIELAERVELWNHRHYMAAHLGHVAWARGEWPDAEALAAHALADGRGGITTRITALHVLGYVNLGRGHFDGAERILTEALELGDQMAELQRVSPALWGLAEAALLAGDPQRAIAWCERGEAASSTVADAAYLFPFLVTGTRAHLAAGDPAAAAAWATRVSDAVAHRGIPGTMPAIDHARGLLELSNGSTGRARASLELARVRWHEHQRTWEGSWATIDLAATLARSNLPAEARRLAVEVDELATRLGSAPLMQAARDLLVRLKTRTGPTSAWAPLTAREYAVARLITQGMTNSEIATELGIAPRTATSHVEHILAKLGVTRRAEAAAWVARTAAMPPAPNDAADGREVDTARRRGGRPRQGSDR